MTELVSQRRRGQVVIELTKRLTMRPCLNVDLPEREHDGDYKNLYYNDVQVSEEAFRIGGLGGTFKDGYCGLLTYPNVKEDSSSWGCSCIINEQGEIVYQVEMFDKLHHIGGIIATTKKHIVNLETGKEILPEPTSSLKSEDFLFAKIYSFDYHKKDGFKDLETGIYMINLKTAKYKFYK